MEELAKYENDPLQDIYRNGPTNLNEYIDLYDDKLFRLDGSIQYLYHLDKFLENIHFKEKPRIAIILRDPVARAVSHYKFL